MGTFARRNAESHEIPRRRRSGRARRSVVHHALRGLDAKIAATYVALLSGDLKAAKAAGDAAVQGSDSDAGAQYVAAEAALLAGDTKTATAAMKLAADKEPRPLYGIGLARAHAAAYHWDEAIAALDKVRGAAADHPGTIIARARILAQAGRIAASGALNPIELADVRSTAEILAPIAAETGGTVRRLEGAGVPELRKIRPGREASGNGWIGIAANRDYLVTGIDQVPLLPGFVALALLLGTALIAWHREGR